MLGRNNIFFCKPAFGAECRQEEFRKELLSARKLIAYEAPLVPHSGVLKGSRTYACTLISFRIDADGSAIDPVVIASFPSPVLNEVALVTLSEYKFKMPMPSRNEVRFYLLFEESVKD